MHAHIIPNREHSIPLVPTKTLVCPTSLTSLALIQPQKHPHFATCTARQNIQSTNWVATVQNHTKVWVSYGHARLGSRLSKRTSTPITMRNRYSCIQTVLTGDSQEFKLGYGEAWLTEMPTVSPPALAYCSQRQCRCVKLYGIVWVLTETQLVRALKDNMPGTK